MGYFDDKNGIFFEYSEAIVSIILRTNSSGRVTVD
tara:strand:+ start:417 stop:521 length:105 start_codon:yes stop_codon:yes gene_type:complete